METVFFFKSGINFSVSLFFPFVDPSNLLQNEFTSTSHISNSAIQSVPNRFVVLGRMKTFDLNVFLINNIYQLNSPLTFSLLPDTLCAAFLVFFNGGLHMFSTLVRL